MKSASGNSGTKSRRSARKRALDLLAEGEVLTMAADRLQTLATATRKEAEAKIAQAKALLPLPLFEAARRRH